MSVPINPETKVGALLEAYPGIDEVLIAWVPAFAKLRNPILRKTVAKVATLEQAAKVGGVSVRELVRKLREATGQAALDLPAESAPSRAGEPPDWLQKNRVDATIDADALLKTGEHPIGKVRLAAGALKPGGMVRLLSSFRPEPLIQSMLHAGFQVYSAEQAPGEHATYIARRA